MPSPGSCSRCSKPLLVESDSGLCPACARVPAVAETTAPNTSVRPGTDVAPPRAPPPAADSTAAHGAGTTGTWPPPLGETTANFAEAAPADRAYLPEAPPGYTLIRQLGSGGMGSVYLARETAAERTVAVKFLHAPGHGDAFDRFLREVRSMARLDHPNIVKVIAVETNWHRPFFTMEYVGGGTLADFGTPDNPLPDPTTAARLILAVAEAVACAHAANILHRDLKPSNILLSGVGSQVSGVGAGDATTLLSSPTPDSRPLTPKVSDFGLAKLTDRDDQLTRTGPMGTPSYMSPEAAAGRHAEVGPPADVYGLGATLYFLLGGRAPFEGNSSRDVIRTVIQDEPPRLRAVNPAVPAALEAIVAKCLEKKPAGRYATADELAADLRRFLEGQRPAAPVLSWPRRARRWLGRNRGSVAAGVCAGLALAGVVWLAVLAAHKPAVAEAPAPPDPRDVIRKELQAGRPVTLIGETGEPVWHKWQLNAAVLGKSPTGDPACYFQSFSWALLELHDDPGIDRYRIRADLRQPRPPGLAADVGTIGLYFGYGYQPGRPGTAVHSFYAVDFQDRDPNPGQPGARTQKARFQGQLLRHDPRGETSGGTVRCGHHVFVPAPSNPGHWRTIEVEVTPTLAEVRWQAGPTRLENFTVPAPVNPAEKHKDLQAALDANLPGTGVVLAPWSPRMPVGVYAYWSTLEVRNFTITPLP